MLYKYLVISIFIFAFFQHEETRGHCSSCTVTINGNGIPSSPIINNSVVCISGTRTIAIDFMNRTGITICIDANANVNAPFNSLASLNVINNFGAFTAGNDFNGNWTINNFSTLNFNTNINSNKTVNNYSVMNVAGNLIVDGRLNSIGQLSIGGSATFNSSSNVTLQGNTSIGGSAVINSTIRLAGSITIAGAAQINSNAGFISLNANQCNSISVAGSFSNSGTISGNNLNYLGTGASLFVNKLPTGNPLGAGAVLGTCGGVNCLEFIQMVNSNNERDEVYIYRCSDEFILPTIIDGEELIDAMALVVGGGGGGGIGDGSGGGGAGGMFFVDGLTLVVGNPYQVVIGAGGRGSFTAQLQGNNGSPSSFFGINAIGGGGGGSDSSHGRLGKSGGSGGGGAFSSLGLRGANTQGSLNLSFGGSTFANEGGNGSHSGASSNRSGGGGGGASGSGNAGNGNIAGFGGNGWPSIILDGVQGGNIFNGFGGGGGATGRNSGGQRNRSLGGTVGSVPLGGSGNANSGGVGEFGLMNTGSGGGAGRGGGGDGGSGIVIIRVSFKVLPVELVNFSAKYIAEENKVKLNWSTAKEWENSRFEIERSVGNISDFEKIGEVSGMGWKETITEYEYLDTKLPLIGGNVYYRLKQVDINGKYSLSKVMSVKIQGVQFTQGVWRAYPNPTNGEQLRVSLLDKTQYNQESISFRIIHPTSISQETAVPSENDMNEVLAQMVGSIPKGVFVVEVRWGQKVEHIKVIKK